MKVTFVLEGADLAGGVRVVAEYARRLMHRGHGVVVVSTPHPVLPLRLKLSHVYRRHRWPIRRPLGPSHLDGTGVVHRRIERHRPVIDADLPDADVVIATTWRTGHWIHALSPQKGAHVHFMQHYETWAGWDAPTGCPAAWRLPSSKIVISRWLEDLCRREFHQPCTHIPNAVDTGLFHAPPRELQSVGGGVPTVGFLYHDIAFKGVDVTLAAVDIIRRRLAATSPRADRPALRVVAFGRDQPTPRLPLPPGTHYERLPAQARLRELYAMCDVWLCGSRAEGFHLPPLEAMACRTPVVSTRVGGPEDVIDDGINGHLVDIEDHEKLAARALRVLSLPPEQWRRMSDAAHRTAHQHTWDDATDRFEASLARAVAARKQWPAVQSTAAIESFPPGATLK